MLTTLSGRLYTRYSPCRPCRMRCRGREPCEMGRVVAGRDSGTREGRGEGREDDAAVADAVACGLRYRAQAARRGGFMRSGEERAGQAGSLPLCMSPPGAPARQVGPVQGAAPCDSTSPARPTRPNCAPAIHVLSFPLESAWCRALVPHLWTHLGDHAARPGCLRAGAPTRLKFAPPPLAPSTSRLQPRPPWRTPRPPRRRAPWMPRHRRAPSACMHSLDPAAAASSCAASASARAPFRRAAARQDAYLRLFTADAGQAARRFGPRARDLCSAGPGQGPAGPRRAAWHRMAHELPPDPLPYSGPPARSLAVKRQGI